MRKITRKGLIRKLDKICSDIVRGRGYCQKCNQSDPRHLQTAHIFSRRFHNTRWDIKLNLVCLCDKCHWDAHLKPLLFSEWVKDFLGEYNYNALKNNAATIKKWTTEELKELLITLQTLGER